MRLRPCPSLALLLVPAALAATGTRGTWDFAPFSYVRRCPAEKGAPANSHPLQVDAAVLAQALGSVRFLSGREEAPLFVPAEVEGLAKALAEALAVAGPGEDLAVLSTRKRDKVFLRSSMAVTGRVFVQDGRLNLIIHEARLDYHLEYNLQNRMPDFDYGSRAIAGAETLKAPGAEVRRADWLVLPLGALAPVAAAQPAPAPAPVQEKVPSATVEERLRELKRFREQDLITEEEYSRQKQELLKAFSKPS